MVATGKKLRPLEIDTKSTRPPTPLSPCSEEKHEVLSVNSPATVNIRPKHHLTTDRFSNKRYSTSYLHQPINEYIHQENLHLSPIHDTKLNGHKRSTSADNETVTLPRNQSVPDLKSKRASYDAKNPIKSTGDTLKKKWFQLPRITLKRQASTPQKSGYGGLKAGLVEPPEPPPQLLFNLDWSSKDSALPILWDNDVSNFSIGTPTSPVIRRRCSGYGFEIMLSNTHNRDTTEANATMAINDIPSEDDKIKLTRRLSCPNYENFLTSTKEDDSTPQLSPVTPNETTVNNNIKVKHNRTGSSGKLFSNFQRPNASNRGVSNDGHGVIPSASSSTSSVTPSSSPPSPLSSPKPNHSEDYKLLLFTVHAPNTNEVVLNFNNIKPRVHKLKRKTNSKLEQKALHFWQNQLLQALNDMESISPKDHVISDGKKERYFLTRKFILREFYTTEINFWNQLNYAKVMFSDPLQLAIERHSEIVKPADTDWFANLNDLIRFSSTLILRLRTAQIAKSPCAGTVCKEASVDPSCQTCPIDISIGSILRELAEHMAVFLRCALDYRANKKLVDHKMHNKAYALYSEKLNLRKETRQFTFHDYLIIPIQRITRYGLLLADLEKHTEATHTDYENIRVARCIIRSLADAMNSVQKK